MAVDGGQVGRVAPFATLLTMASLIFAVLLVAGFSYRWAYFYNFGLKDLASQESLQSIAIASMELFRSYSVAIRTIIIVGAPTLFLNVLLYAVRSVPQQAGYFRKIYFSANVAGIRSDFFVDIVRATILFYSAYWSGSEAGYVKFEQHSTETTLNTLPIVTIAAAGSAASSLPVECIHANWDDEKNEKKSPIIIGSSRTLALVREGLACNISGQRTWRLLHRDDKNTYVFATSAKGTRPLTLIIPASSESLIILGGVD